MDTILEILEKDARTTAGDISKLTKLKKDLVKKKIKKFEKDGVILKYKTVINKN